MYPIEGIVSLYLSDLEKRQSKLENLPAGDERAVRSEIAKKVRSLIMNLEHEVMKGFPLGERMERMIDDIEKYLVKI